jgi:hypothetical protein
MMSHSTSDFLVSNMKILAVNSWRTRPLAFAACVLLLSQRADAGNIIENGQAKGRIIVPAGADSKIIGAAHKLSGYLLQMTGVSVTVQTDASPIPAGRHIRIGSTAGAPVNSAWVTEQQVGLDGFVFKPASDGIILAGANAYGTTNAVYRFAEQALGVHWFSPEDSAPTVPQQTTVAVPSLNQTVKPDLKWRGQYYSFQQREDYQTLGVVAQQISASRDAWWTFNRMSSPPTYEIESGHSFHQFVPDSLYASHPEYFPLVNYTFGAVGPNQNPYVNRVPTGNPPQRMPGISSQRELSNPDVQQLAIQWTRNQFAANPNLAMASLAASDGPWWSISPQFLAMGPDDTSRYVAFVNIVAEANEALYPNRGYTFLAYDGSTTLTPPSSNIVVHPNATPVVAPLFLDRMHSILSNHPDAVYLREAIDGWSNISQQITYRPYMTDGPLTLPGALTLADETKYLHDHGNIGGFREHQYLPSVGWALMNWMEVQLMWDADQDPRQLRRQFMDGYYGPGSGATADQVFEVVETNLRNTIIPGDPSVQVSSRDYLKPIIEPALPQIGLALREAQSELAVQRQRLERDMWKLAEIGATPVFAANFDANADGTLLGKTTTTGQTWETFAAFGTYGSLSVAAGHGLNGSKGAGTRSNTFAGNTAQLGTTLSAGLVRVSMDLQTQAPGFGDSTTPVKQWWLRDSVNGTSASVFWEADGDIAFEGLGINSAVVPSGMFDNGSMHLSLDIDLETREVVLNWFDNDEPGNLSRSGRVVLGAYAVSFAPNVFDIWGRGESNVIFSGYDNIRLINVPVELDAFAFGDFNSDGIVDVADYTVWRDGLINGLEGYAAWKSNFGRILTSGTGQHAENHSVPEPSSALLLLILAGPMYSGKRF